MQFNEKNPIMMTNVETGRVLAYDAKLYRRAPGRYKIDEKAIPEELATPKEWVTDRFNLPMTYIKEEELEAGAEKNDPQVAENYFAKRGELKEKYTHADIDRMNGQTLRKILRSCYGEDFSTSTDLDTLRTTLKALLASSTPKEVNDGNGGNDTGGDIS